MKNASSKFTIPSAGGFAVAILICLTIIALFILPKNIEEVMHLLLAYFLFAIIASIPPGVILLGGLAQIIDKIAEVIFPIKQGLLNIFFPAPWESPDKNVLTSKQEKMYKQIKNDILRKLKYNKRLKKAAYLNTEPLKFSEEVPVQVLYKLREFFQKRGWGNFKIERKDGKNFISLFP
jgi:hypothetical protein